MSNNACDSGNFLPLFPYPIEERPQEREGMGACMYVEWVWIDLASLSFCVCAFLFLPSLPLSPHPPPLWAFLKAKGRQGKILSSSALVESIPNHV